MFIFLIGFSWVEAQNVGIGIEAQKYPVGHIWGGRVDITIGIHNTINFRVGYNFARHQDFGVHQDERGGGFGGSVGVRHYTGDEKSKWFIGLRTDLWFNTIDWKDNIGKPNEISGITKITVLQPTLEGGYGFFIG